MPRTIPNTSYHSKYLECLVPARVTSSTRAAHLQQSCSTRATYNVRSTQCRKWYACRHSRGASHSIGASSYHSIIPRVLTPHARATCSTTCPYHVFLHHMPVPRVLPHARTTCSTTCSYREKARVTLERGLRRQAFHVRRLHNMREEFSDIGYVCVHCNFVLPVSMATECGGDIPL